MRVGKKGARTETRGGMGVRERVPVIFEAAAKIHDPPCTAFRAVRFLRAALGLGSLRPVRGAWDGHRHVCIGLTALEMLCLHTACALESQEDRDFCGFGPLADVMKVMVGCTHREIAWAQFELCAALDWRVYGISPFGFLLEVPTTDASWGAAAAFIYGAVAEGVDASPRVLALASLLAAARGSCSSSTRATPRSIRDAAKTLARDEPEHVAVELLDAARALALPLAAIRTNPPSEWLRKQPPPRPPTPAAAPPRPPPSAGLEHDATGTVDAYHTLETPPNARHRWKKRQWGGGGDPNSS